MGVSSGFPDITIPYPSASYYGLYIELKRTKGGVVSPNQVSWITFLREQGYYADISKGADDAIELVTWYLQLAKPAA